MAATARQFEILRLLRATDGSSLLTLATRLGVAKNTIQRGIDHLCTAGVSITEEKQGQTVFYSLFGSSAESVGKPDLKSS